MIGVENVVRRLRQNRGWPSRAEARVVLDAILEVRAAVVYATFAVLLVFFPILGASRELPAASSRRSASPTSSPCWPRSPSRSRSRLRSRVLLLTGKRRDGEQRRNRLWCAGRDGATKPCSGPHRPVPQLGHVRRRPVRPIAGAAMLPFFGGTFLPDLREGHLILHVTATSRHVAR